VWTV